MANHGRDEPQLLTFGEAAEFAAVSLMELRGALAGHSSPSVWGWRGGARLQLVSVSDLEHIYPAIREKARNSGLTLEERGISLTNPADQGTPSTQLGSPRARSRAAEPVVNPVVDPDSATLRQPPRGPRAQPNNTPKQTAADSGSPGTRPPVVGPAENPGVPSGQTAGGSHAAPSPEGVEALYKEIEAKAQRNQELLSELKTSGAGLGKLLDDSDSHAGANWRTPASSPASSPLGTPPSEAASGTQVVGSNDRQAEWERLVSAESNMERRQRRNHWVSWGLAAVLLVALATKGKDLLFAAGQPGVPDLPAEDPHRVADRVWEQGGTQATAFVQSEGDPQSPGREPAQPKGEVQGSDMALATFREASAGPKITLPSQKRPELSPEIPDAEDGTAVASSEKSTPSEPTEPGADASPEEASDGLPEAPAAKEREASTGLDKAEAIDKEYLPLEHSKTAPCQYAGLTGVGMELRSVLGPCIGPWNKSERAVAGGFRHSGFALCRHHYTFQKELSGSVDRAKKVAAYAKQEGLLAPLVRLRVEHGASQLLRSRLGKWVESGFEAGLSEHHRISPVADAPQRWLVESWVRLQTKGSVAAPVKRFRLELEWDMNRGRDRMVSFAWVKDS